MRAYEAMALTNPLHPDVFPSARQMEAEVVAMTASFLGGGRAGPCRTVCGAMTSGGTESILSAVKASRDFMFSRRPATRDAPEMVLADSAHPAYLKAASYFKIRGEPLPGLGSATRRINARRCVLVPDVHTVVLVCSGDSARGPKDLPPARV